MAMLSVFSNGTNFSKIFNNAKVYMQMLSSLTFLSKCPVKTLEITYVDETKFLGRNS